MATMPNRLGRVGMMWKINSPKTINITGVYASPSPFVSQEALIHSLSVPPGINEIMGELIRNFIKEMLVERVSMEWNGAEILEALSKGDTKLRKIGEEMMALLGTAHATVSGEDAFREVAKLTVALASVMGIMREFRVAVELGEKRMKEYDLVEVDLVERKATGVYIVKNPFFANPLILLVS